MSSRLKYVDPNRQRGWFSRAYATSSNTRLGASSRSTWSGSSILACHGQARRVASDGGRRRGWAPGLWALADQVFAPHRREARRQAGRSDRPV